MAVITIREYASLPKLEGPNGSPQIAKEPCIATKTYAIGAASAASDVFSPGTSYIRIDVDAICRWEVAAASPGPVALVANTGTKAGSSRLPADGREFVGVTAGHKIAFIADV